MRRIKLYEILLIIFIVFSIGLSAHFTLIDRVGFWRLVYPLQALFSILSINCSENAPNWMKESLKYIIKNQRNLSNQIAYIDKKNNIHTCQSGWKGVSVFSEALNENTRFRYASLTKLLTSHSILSEINRGRLKIDSKLIELLPELKQIELKDERIKNITIGDLLEHRSGFDRMRSEDIVFAINKKSWCPYDLTALTRQRLDFEPNAKYAYDNRNYCLLGAVIERLSGQPYRSYMAAHYPLAQYNMKFVDGAYFADEVHYDFRNNDYWMPSQDNQFDFNALSSSAGLSGSASALAKTLNTFVQDSHVNILAISSNAKANCQLDRFESCNGYTMWQYQPNTAQAPMYFRRGGLPAVTSLAMITQDKEVIVWMGNGAISYKKHHDQHHLERYFYQLLSQQ